MRVLVTGAFGLLGTSLSRRLSAIGYEVLMHGQSRGALAGDLRDLAFGLELLKVTRPNFIINLAASTDVDGCEKTPNSAYLTNAKIVENFAHNIEWLVNNLGHKIHLIQISTDQVYDGIGPHNENDISLTNYYAYSKYLGERAAIKVGGTVLRTNFFGVSECLSRSSFSDWIVRALESGETINAFEDIKFSPLSMFTLIDAIDLALKNPICGVFNLGSSNGMSKADFILFLARCCDLSVRRIKISSSNEFKQFAYRPKDMRMNSNKFSQAFNFIIPDLKDQIKLVSLGYMKN